MIIKSYEVGKKNLSEMMIFVIYGENEGLKKDIIKIIKKNYPGEQITYDEAEIFNNKTEMITKNRGIMSKGENKKPLLKFSFFCKNPLLFNEKILLNINYLSTN